MGRIAGIATENYHFVMGTIPLVAAMRVRTFLLLPCGQATASSRSGRNSGGAVRVLNIMIMPLTPSWTDIAVRLALTMLAGAVVGLNRGARGHAAGFRTTILVALAASLAMILTNILLSVTGKSQDSFTTMDTMRLPLGILTGVGFIGAGTIVKKGDMITGVTTAATLWLITVIGFCFGAGQLVLGTAATLLAVFTLWILKWADVMMPREHRARVVISCAPSWRVLEDVSNLLR